MRPAPPHPRSSRRKPGPRQEEREGAPRTARKTPTATVGRPSVQPRRSQRFAETSPRRGLLRESPRAPRFICFAATRVRETYGPERARGALAHPPRSSRRKPGPRQEEREGAPRTARKTPTATVGPASVQPRRSQRSAETSPRRGLLRESPRAPRFICFATACVRGVRGPERARGAFALPPAWVPAFAGMSGEGMGGAGAP